MKWLTFINHFVTCVTFQFFQCVPKKPVFVMTWEGKDPTLPSILLNSHIDVVPVFYVRIMPTSFISRLLFL